MGEWFSESKDESAAFEEFAEILGGDKAKRKELRDAFIKEFKEIYDAFKKDVIEYVPGHRSPQFLWNAWSLAGAIEGLKDVSSELEQVKILGRTLGFWLAFVEYGLTDKRLGLDKDANDFLRYAERTSQGLKTLNKSVKHKFIKKRLMKIASKHKDLSKNQQELIAEIAQIFAS